MEKQKRKRVQVKRRPGRDVRTKTFRECALEYIVAHEGDRSRRQWTETLETEQADIGAALRRCRVLAAKIANELRNKRPEHFVDKLSLADIHASLERAADVLSTVKGSQRPRIRA